MRQDMSGQLRNAIANAQVSARHLNQDFVSSEHLLLGVLAASGSQATAVLQKDEVSLSELRDALLASLPHAQNDPVVTGDLPLSPKAKRAVHTALVKAQAMQEPSITTRHLVLALLDEPETAIRDALRRCGADLDQLIRLLMEKPAQAED